MRTSEDVNATEISSTAMPDASYDDIYSEWSQWKRCNRRCKQVRTRTCKSNQICGTTVLKEERGCTGGRCMLTTNLPTTDQQEPSRGRGRTNEFRVLYHLQSMIYSKWSEWSPCTRTCRTRRYRACEISEICGSR